ncbi:MAG TPA: 3-oxoacyl-[acyl-carrier-protein] reductase [Caldisericia bacterium]|nr:3-oxoacyl-[acyl-carrier-protein] reductase [Caldisericia bacterium]HPF49199.1 3-oxoacyl-[acyl-carrier-protein] reductase [Caldisericia bacterium]HPI84122.1 3-oxoacyl-[acyl-carrier-protein] reductase [Caldisericia bacterium]HPQ93379.1 3-oxoacyl-[acyl-carrier-protein] reductase [Caldisericia bacterium]HRV75239.1 3-oxoacyl-[acyl-carrier-protein] reductase [Caldisericia bacterium]
MVKDRNLEGKVALVTGASRGIGRSIALILAERGASIAVNYPFEAELENAQETVRLVKELGVDAMVIEADVSNLTSCDAMINDVVEKMGALDILVNNAGITIDKLMLRMTGDDWDKVINVNLTGCFNCTKAALRTLMKSKGRIINISSVIGIMGNPGQANYAASKAGIIALTKSVAKEMGSRGITCNAIAPGFIQTPMTDSLTEEVKSDYLSRIPLRRFGTASDIGNIVAFLAGPEGSYINGATITVDGGLT